jgi:hypothetical protein
MMKAILKPVVVGTTLVTVLLAFGCTTTVLPVGQTHSNPVAKEQVEVLYQEPQRPHEVLGLVTCDSVTVFASIPGVIQKCREQAAMLGADALIVTAIQGAALGRPARVSGQAIKWK